MLDYLTQYFSLKNENEIENKQIDNIIENKKDKYNDLSISFGVGGARLHVYYKIY
jgi:hypothetical protein